MKRNLVLVGLVLFGLVAAVVPAQAQVAFQMSSLTRDVRLEGTAEAVGAVTLAATTAGTIKTGSTISLDYGTTATTLEALTGVVAGKALGCGGGVITCAVSGNEFTVTFAADQAYVIGDTMTISAVRLNANAFGVGTINATGTATVPAAFATTNPITFFIVTQVPVATVKPKATTVTVASGGGLLTCVPSTTTPGPVIEIDENFNQAVTSKLDEDGFGGTGGGANSVDSHLVVTFPSVPIDVTVSLIGVVGTTADTSTSTTLDFTVNGTATVVAGLPTAGFPLAIPSADGAQDLTFDIKITKTATTGSGEEIFLYFTASTAGAIALGPATVTPTVALTNGGNLAPKVPRFVTNTQGSGTAFGVSDCVTNLLFPWVANVAGYDTGIAIANTTKDPFGAAGGAVAQPGSCTLTGYPAATGTPSVSFTSASVPAGAALTMVLSGTGNPAFNGFVGYIIAVCQFQNAHGFAYITDNFGVGAPNTAQGYVALVIPNPSSTPRNPAGGGKGEGLAE